MTRPAPLPPGPTPAPRARSAARWAAAIAVATAAALAAAGWHGRTSRRTFEPPRELARRRAASVTSAADALLVWREAGARGRRLVLLTGQWSGPRSGGRPWTGARPALGSGSPGDPLTPESAVYWTARLGVARAIDVVMPPAPFEARRAADAGHKAFRPEGEAYRHDLHGYALRFSPPRAFVPPAEPALVLVEPTWFAAGAPPDPLAWLSSLGVRTELALVALEDPAATGEDRRAAAEYVRSTDLPRLQIVRTRSP